MVMFYEKRDEESLFLYPCAFKRIEYSEATQQQLVVSLAIVLMH